MGIRLTVLLGLLMILQPMAAKSNIDQQYMDVTFWNTGKVFSFMGNRNAKLHIKAFKNPNAKGQIIISHGFTESNAKYMEVAQALFEAGYSIYLPDHRGHGLSEGDTTKTSLVHVISFQDYTEDLLGVSKTFLREKLPRYIIAHSMGAAIALGAMQKAPNFFDKAIFSAPMFQIKLGNMPEWVALSLCRVSHIFGLEENFLPGSGPPEYPISFSATRATTSKKRFYRYMNYLKEHNYDVKWGGSFGWLKESILYTRKITQKEKLQELKTPLLILQAGDDAYVKAEGMETLCSETNCKLIKFQDAKHEIYFEKDSTHSRWLSAVLSFLSGKN